MVVNSAPSAPPRLAGKTAVVTGAGHGIGRAIALGLAANGARVVVADRDEAAAHDVAATIGASGDAVAMDVSVRDQVEAVMQVAGTPDVVVCCAGIHHSPGTTGLLDLDDAEWERVLDVNLRGTFLCIQTAARRLVAAGRAGSIVTVASIGAFQPTAGAPAYVASKGGVVSLTRSTAVSLAPHHIRVNALAPGYILTDMTRASLDRPDIWDAAPTRRIPLGRMGAPEDFAGAAVFLASDESSFITGEVLTIDGGTLVQGWTSAEVPPKPRTCSDLASALTCSRMAAYNMQPDGCLSSASTTCSRRWPTRAGGCCSTA